MPIHAIGKKVHVVGIGTCTFIRTEREGHSRVLYEEKVFIDTYTSVGYQLKEFVVRNEFMRLIDDDNPIRTV